MRNTNIISSIANGISNFVSAANDALRQEMQLQLPGYLCLKPAIVGSGVLSATRLHAGIAGTASQSRTPEPANWPLCVGRTSQGTVGIEQVFDTNRTATEGRSREFAAIFAKR